MKPFDIDTLFTRIRQLVQPQSNGAGILHEQRWAIVEEQASKLMVELGIPPHFKGFAYLKDAIGFVVQDPELVSQITTRLYPMIAQRYRTTAAKVERAIRQRSARVDQRRNQDELRAVCVFHRHRQRETHQFAVHRTHCRSHSSAASNALILPLDHCIRALRLAGY